MQIATKPQTLNPHEKFTITLQGAKFPPTIPVQIQATALRAVDPNTRAPMFGKDNLQIVYWDASLVPGPLKLGDYTLHMPPIAFEATRPEPEITRQAAIDAVKAKVSLVLAAASLCLAQQPHGHYTAMVTQGRDDGLAIDFTPGGP